MFSLGGSTSGSSARQHTRRNTVGSETETGLETYERGTFDTTEDIELLSRLLRSFNLQDVQADSAAEARASAGGAIENLFTQYSEQVLPDILSGQSSAGAYGSTGAQFTANDAFARTVAQAAELELGLAQNLTNQRMQEQARQTELFANLIQSNLQQSGRSRSERDREYEESMRERVRTDSFTLNTEGSMSF